MLHLKIIVNVYHTSLVFVLWGVIPTHDRRTLLGYTNTEQYGFCPQSAYNNTSKTPGCREKLENLAPLLPTPTLPTL